MSRYNKKQSKRPFTILVEGNIGSGKTTFLEYFKDFQDICILTEPVDLWRNLNGHNLLEKLYQEPKKWAHTFQSYVQLTTMKHHLLPTDCSVKLMERSVYSARYCFVEKMYRDGVIPSASVAVMDEWFTYMQENLNVSIDLIVYLRATPKIVHERMLKRNRSEEKSVPLDYLIDLHNLHEDWLYYKKNFNCPAPVLTINANLDKSVIHEEYEKCKIHVLNKVDVKA